MLLNGCDEDNNKPNPIQNTKVHFNLHWGKSINSGTIHIYRYNPSGRGDMIDSFEINSGTASTELSIADGPILVELSSIQYIEKFSQRAISEQNIERISWLLWHNSDQERHYNLSALSLISSGLTKYYLLSNMGIQEAISRGREVTKEWLTFDPYEISPTDISDTASLSPELNNGLRAGFLLSAISLQTANFSTRIWPNSETHQLLNTLIYAYDLIDDIQHDGVINGVDSNGIQYRGTYQLNSEWYRYQLSSHIIFASSSPTNVSGIGRPEIGGYAILLANSNHDFLTGSSRSIQTDGIVIDGLDVYHNRNFSGILPLEWTILSFLEISRTKIIVDGAIILDMPYEVNQYNLDTTLWQDGSYRMVVEVQDVGGAVTASQIDVRINNQTFTISDITPTNNSLIGRSLEYSYTASTSQIYSITNSHIVATIGERQSTHPCVITSTSHTITCRHSIDFPIHSSGVINIMISAFNNAIPIEMIQLEQTLTYDAVNPVIDFGSLIDNQLLTINTPIIRVSVSDSNLSSVMVVVNDDVVSMFNPQQNSNTYYWDFNPRQYSDGVKRIDIIATDHAGNQTMGSRSTVIDTSPPIVTISPLQSSYQSTTIQLTGTITDSTIGGADIYIDHNRIGETTVLNSMWSFNLNTANYTDGSHSLEIRAYDSAGNTATAEQNIVVDNDAPNVLINSSGLISSSYTNNRYRITGNISEDTSQIAGFEVRLGNALISNQFTFSDDNLNRFYGIVDIGWSLTESDAILVFIALDSAGNSSSHSLRLSRPFIDIGSGLGF